MAGTRTAPAVNGTPVVTRVTLRVIDFAGDRRAFGVDIVNAFGVPTNAEIETMVNAYQAASNSSVYAVEVTYQYQSAYQASQAANAVRSSADDVIVVNLGDPTKRYQPIELRAPLASQFTPVGSETPNPAATELGALIVAVLTVINGGGSGTGTYTAKSARFSEHSEINPAVPA